MKRLYTPFKVNKLELKNRVIMSPMSIGHTVDGFIMDDVVEFYKRRAQGGVGLIIFANMQWDKLRYNPNHGAMLTDEKYIPSLKKLTDAIHEGGSKVFAQLMHRGRCANRASIQGEQAVAPSPIPGRFTHFEMPKELTVEEIKEFVDWQAEAAVIAKKAGFDGIEIETNSGYLYGQFFSPLTNHRTDEYGGSLENRCRFMVETLEGMRAAVGPDYPISLRVSGSDFMDGGCNGDDIAEICELLDKTGYVDGFSITAGWHESAVPLITMEVPHGAWAYLGRQIKARVKAPVAQGMRMNIEKAEELVDRGDFDAIVMGRPFLADPDVVNKAEAGKASTIRPCVGCNAKCLDMAMVSKPIGCIGNYECNREEELEDENGLMPTEKKSEHPEKILVIGAGPSGMEFARVAALRGHKVTIWEKRNRTIGLSLYAIVAVVTNPNAEKPHKGISLLIIPTDAPGFERKLLNKIGLNSQDTSEYIFHDVVVPEENLLGEENRGFYYLMQHLEKERLMGSWGTLGMAEYAFELCVQRANERLVAGKPLGAYQHWQFEIAKAAAELDQARSYVEHLTLLFMAGESVNTQVSIAKYATSELAYKISDLGVQIWGGPGILRDNAIARQFVDTRHYRLMAGTSEVQLGIIAKAIGLGKKK